MANPSSLERAPWQRRLLEAVLVMLSLAAIAVVVVGPHTVLKLLQPAATATEPTVTWAFSRELRFRWSEKLMRGDDVRFVQSRLIAASRSLASSTGFSGIGTPSGVFDRRTSMAVLTFQHRLGLPATGVVDRATWDALSR